MLRIIDSSGIVGPPFREFIRPLVEACDTTFRMQQAKCCLSVCIFHSKLLLQSRKIRSLVGASDIFRHKIGMSNILSIFFAS